MLLQGMGVLTGAGGDRVRQMVNQSDLDALRGDFMAIGGDFRVAIGHSIPTTDSLDNDQAQPQKKIGAK